MTTREASDASEREIELPSGLGLATAEGMLPADSTAEQRAAAYEIDVLIARAIRDRKLRPAAVGPWLDSLREDLAAQPARALRMVRGTLEGATARPDIAYHVLTHRSVRRPSHDVDIRAGWEAIPRWAALPDGSVITGGPEAALARSLARRGLSPDEIATRVRDRFGVACDANRVRLYLDDAPRKETLPS